MNIMISSIKPYLNGSKKRLFSLFVSVVISYISLLAQIKYLPVNEYKDAAMGVERVARFFTPSYESKLTQKDGEIRWVQVDLGKREKIDGIKLLPKINPWNNVISEGFPSRFKIEVSDDADFNTAIIYQNETREDFKDPYDEVITFSGKEVYGRYVRFTALRLRQKRLALSKLMVLSDGKDIAQGCPASDSESGDLGTNVLTRPQRPQGEGVVTDNPGNIIPFVNWNPVVYKAQVPKGGVQLSDGLFNKTMENNISYLMNSFTLDELVRNYYMKAGFPVKPLDKRLSEFWFLDLPGQEAGWFLMGAGNTLRWMENTELRKRMDSIVDVIDQCKEADGYIMAYPKNKIFACQSGGYVKLWITHGLIEAGNSGNKKAFSLLRNFYDWFNNSCYLPELLRRAGVGNLGSLASTRMYFTPVGKPQDIQVVQQYFQENYWMEQLAKREEKAIWLYPYDRPHNYLIAAIEPYLDLYRATGEKKYLDAALGGWNLYHDNWEHIGGSIAICEGFDLYPPKSYALHKSTGELCGSVFWAFLNQRFHLLNPKEEKYVTEIEKSIYNNLIANQLGTKGIRYHAVLDGHKDSNKTFQHCMCTCCEGQGTRMMGALPEFIYSVADDGVYVDLFAPSTIEFITQTGAISLKMATQFPYSSTVQLTVNVDKPAKSSIRIRIPSWATKKMSVMVNGKTFISGTPGTYVVIDRQWKDGDIISFSLPIDFKMTKYEGGERDPNNEKYALEYGPILMAFVNMKEQKKDLAIPTNPEKLIKSLKPVAGKPLHFSVNGNTDFEYMPYLEVQDEQFSCFPKSN
jgi:uncharacterized protein